MADDRTSASLEVLTDLLALRPTTPGDPPAARLGVVTSRGVPRFLVPLGWPPAAAASCLAYQGLRIIRTRASRFVVGTALRTAAGRRLVVDEHLSMDVGPGSLMDHLREVLEHDDLAVAIGIRPMHDLWRPTLQIFRPDGTPLAYVKIGTDPVVAGLVRNEADTMLRWADHPDPRLVVPEPIATTEWKGSPVLSIAPMPTEVRAVPPGPMGAWPVRLLDEPLADAPLSRAPWWTERRTRFADEPDISRILERVELRNREADQAWARWHGDWVFWNLARCSSGLVAWDWEYSEPGAPVGLDETHGAFQVARVYRGLSITDAMAVARHAAPSPWVADAHVAMLVTRAGAYRQTSGKQSSEHDALLRAADAALR